MNERGYSKAFDEAFHFQPEVLQLLIDTIPCLCRSKMDTLLFFRGAGTPDVLTRDIEQRVLFDRENIGKHEISRLILRQLNERGDEALRVRREIVKRVVEFDSFDGCWENDRLKAKGLVSEFRKIVQVKDSFTRMKQEREKERRLRAEEHRQRIRETQEKNVALEDVKKEFYALFSYQDEQQRGSLLEKVLNQLFHISEILVRESFRRTGEKGQGVVEQIDGVIEIDGQIYLAEMKWLAGNVSKADVSQHLVRIYHRGSSRGIFISYTEFTEPALDLCKEALQRTVVILCTLHELAMLLERKGDLKDFLKEKIQAAIVDKQPFKRIMK